MELRSRVELVTARAGELLDFIPPLTEAVDSVALAWCGEFSLPAWIS